MTAGNIDRVLDHAVRSGLVPGIVALAADRNGTFYQGAFGNRGLSEDAPMTADTAIRHASCCCRSSAGSTKAWNFPIFAKRERCWRASVGSANHFIPSDTPLRLRG
jgi:hypothetical protein